MIVDYYLIKRALLRRATSCSARAAATGTPAASTGSRSARGSSAPSLAYVWAYVWPLPFGSTAPAFIVTFVLYLAGLAATGVRRAGSRRSATSPRSRMPGGRRSGLMSGCCMT